MKQKSETKKILTFFLIAILISLGVNFVLLKEIKNVSLTLKEEKTKTEAEFSIIKNILNNVQEDYQKKVNILKKAIEKIEEESDIKITELEEELKNVNIKSGDFSAVIDDALKGVVSIITDKSQGSGAIITKDGFIITNYHVIQDAKAINVVDYKKNIYSVQVNGSNKKLDIAVLKIAPRNHQRLTFTNSDKLKVGEKVVALGNPAGLGFTATEGIISQLNREVSRSLPGLIQIDVPINPGSSGGPIININGNMIGIAKMKVIGFESLGFALPANEVKIAAEDIIGRDF